MNLHARVEALGAESDPKIVVPELRALLEGASQDVSYVGQRVFKHPSARGYASLDRLAESYFAIILTDDVPLDIRLKHDALAPRILNAYLQSDAVVSKSWAGVLTGLREFRVGCRCCGGVMAALVGLRLGGERVKESSFAFSKERFIQLWPGEQPCRELASYNSTTQRMSISWEASRSMVEQAAQAQRDAAEASAATM